MKHFLVFSNQYKDKDLKVTNKLVETLEKKGVKVTTYLQKTDWNSESANDEGINIPEDASLMLVLGGDGTVLRAARLVIDSKIPIVGVNLGKVGYLSQIEPSDIEEAADRLISGDYTAESRMMLAGKVYFNDGTLRDSWALNDIVIGRCSSLQVIEFDVYVNDQFLHKYRADGLIVTTPTGSTSYNLSAGGPIIEPTARIMTLTPICAHSLSQRSIVLPSTDYSVEIRIPPTREGMKQILEVSFDGSDRMQLETGDRVVIFESWRTTDLLQMEKVNFLETLNKKLRENS